MNHISDLSHDELCRLHQQGQISVRANMSVAMHICDDDPRIPKGVRAAHHFWKWVSLLMFIGGPISIIWLKWYWGVLIFFVGSIVMKATSQSAGQFVVEAVLQDESLYYDCLANNVILITRK